jgi:beta-fructofuranosidase
VNKKSGPSTSRRSFLSSAAAAAALSALPFKLQAQADALESKLAADPMRPQFHLLPAKNWMNDPNGPIYFNGQYHMFFQYNPLAAVWGDMSWNHAVSPDMLHWMHLPVAMTPTPDSPDSFGCFSGSAIHAGDRVYFVYTGTKLGPKELATIRDGEDKIVESQCLAWSDDPKLIKWTKDPQPIVPTPPPGMKITGFRDPSIWKQGDSYYMTVGAGESEVGGCVLLYKSKDLKRWEYLHKLTGGEWNGNKTPNPCDDGEMWECPELFPLGSNPDAGHVLIYSTLGKVFWQSGKLDPVTMTFAASKTGELDLGCYYAPKTQLDAQGRRILWGWIQERRPDSEMLKAGWSGMMALPRVLSLDKDGTLRIKALLELSNLRASSIPYQESRANILKTLPKACGEVVATGTSGKPLDLQISDGNNVLLSVNYLPSTHSFTTDGKEFKLRPGDTPTIHAFVDGSVIEIILSDRIGYTKRFYYTSPTAPDLSVRVLEGPGIDVKAWTITPISPNRLTTPARTV